MRRLKMPEVGRPRSGQSSPTSFYLGDAEEKARRLKGLDEQAATLGMNRSQLLQAIGDGKVILVRRKRKANRPAE